MLKDAIGRDWQCGTLQVDLNLPGRLGAHYIDETSQKRTPVMLHRAIFGSLERFFAILLEHHAGRLPAWLAPMQAVVMTITDRQDDYVRESTETLKNQGFRVEADLRNEKVGFKIREHTLAACSVSIGRGRQGSGRESAVSAHSQRQGSGHDVRRRRSSERLRAELESRGRRTVGGLTHR